MYFGVTVLQRSMEDLADVDMEQFDKYRTGNIEITLFQYSERYTSVFVKNNDSAIYLGHIFELNESGKNGRATYVKMTSYWTNASSGQRVADFADIITQA